MRIILGNEKTVVKTIILMVDHTDTQLDRMGQQ